MPKSQAGIKTANKSILLDFNSIFWIFLPLGYSLVRIKRGLWKKLL